MRRLLPLDLLLLFKGKIKGKNKSKGKQLCTFSASLAPESIKGVGREKLLSDVSTASGAEKARSHPKIA